MRLAINAHNSSNNFSWENNHGFCFIFIFRIFGNLRSKECEGTLEAHEEECSNEDFEPGTPTAEENKETPVKVGIAVNLSE